MADQRWKIHICPNGEHNWGRCDCGPGMGTEVEVMAVSEYQALRDAVAEEIERLPTEKQTRRLSGLPVGWVVIGPKARDWLPLAKHGWVEETTEYLEPSEGSRPSYRVTPAGLRALASGLEKYGLSRERS